MTTYEFDPKDLQALNGKTILITGASSGIGRETVKIAHEHGANIAMGDWNEKDGQQLADELGSRAIFRKCDVSKWTDVRDLFQTAWKAFGTIHAVLSNAGINTESLLVHELSAETGELLPPSLQSLEVNLIGTVYVVKCALYYFDKWPKTQCQILLTASAASFLDTPPLHLYCASKAGVLGLMRSMRSQVIKKNATINVVAPWLTVTPMLLPEFRDIWGTLPTNQASGVAHALLLPIIRPSINGKAFFIAGHQIVDFEETLQKTQPLWMGEQLSKDINEGQKRLIP